MALPPLVLVLYTVAAETRLRHRRRGRSWWHASPYLATRLPHPLHPGGIVVAVPVFVAAWALGAVFGLHRRHLRTQLELQERLRRAHVRQAELELVDQRVRIARELHDVVAHGMSVITVQAGFAGLVSDDPDEVRSALGSIETTGRQTLGEMRTLLEVLRDGAEPDEPTLLPAPRLDDLDALVDRIREAGVDVVLTRRGPATRAAAAGRAQCLPDRSGGADQRGQARRSGQGDRARAVRRQRADRSRSATTGHRSDGSVEPGHGITGMLERARILGGTLRAGPLPGGGYEVVGRLPVPDRSATQRRPTADPA